MALIPAIIEFILAHSRRGKGGGGGYGGGGGAPQDPNEAMRKWMSKQFLGEIDNINKGQGESEPGRPKTMIPQLRANISPGGYKFTPVLPGDLAPPQRQ